MGKPARGKPQAFSRDPGRTSGGEATDKTQPERMKSAQQDLRLGRTDPAANCPRVNMAGFRPESHNEVIREPTP